MLGGAYFAVLQGHELSISAKLHSLLKGKGHERGGILAKVSEAVSRKLDCSDPSKNSPFCSGSSGLPTTTGVVWQSCRYMHMPEYADTLPLSG